MRLRALTREDNNELRKLHSKQNLYPFPDLSSPLYCIQRVIEDNGQVLGAALVHLTCEVSLVIDPDLSKITKARVLNEIFKSLFSQIDHYGLSDVHIFVVPETNKEFADLLIKNFGFARTPGIALERWYAK